MEPSQSAPHLRHSCEAEAPAAGQQAPPVPGPSNEAHPALLQHPHFQALYRQLLLSLNQHGWKEQPTPPPRPTRPDAAAAAALQQRLQQQLQRKPPPPTVTATDQDIWTPFQEPGETNPDVTTPKQPAWFPPPAGLVPAALPLTLLHALNPPPVTKGTPISEPQNIPLVGRPDSFEPRPSPRHIKEEIRPEPEQEAEALAEAALEGEEDELETEETEPLPQADDEQKAESKHFREVCQAFATYEQMAMVEVNRVERHFLALTDAEQALLMESVSERIQKIKEGIATNQRFLNLLISQELDIVEDEAGNKGRPPGAEGSALEGLLSEFVRSQAAAKDEGSASSSDYQCCDPIEPGCAIEDCEVSSMNMYKVRSTLKQFAREWSAERAVEREAAFKPLLDALDRYLPLAEFKERHRRPPWVLCPGSGLGRLPFEVVCKGYSCQGNEFSYFMLLGSNFILNHALEPASINLVPFCLNSCNRREHEDHLQVITIPDVCAADGVNADVDFSMCAGDFVEVYTPQKEAWDAVLTCFFIDTAKNVICYLHTIANIIPAGGLWTNMGPLLYHFADSATEMSVELSWEEIRQIVIKYFDIKEERWIDAFYTTPPRSMLQALYHCVFFVAIRNDTPVAVEFLKGSLSPVIPQRSRHPIESQNSSAPARGGGG
eukprot:Protomagalhaensia_sp_Gyna_25__3317@NODE_2_length_10425_cov_76_179954_g1_i0_p1_GENE_NODE_2_length_10425_cov_76_179954_g1_i0NODE_2_length_10425_cov_76_179954_g1_i0_p1_ORF_typecomplete_len662_score148_58N2227/PF07942_12/1_4e92_NODE_2_length_10425_cov_76_179954_g1_i058517836